MAIAASAFAVALVAGGLAATPAGSEPTSAQGPPPSFQAARAAGVVREERDDDNILQRDDWFFSQRRDRPQHVSALGYLRAHARAEALAAASHSFPPLTWTLAGPRPVTGSRDVFQGRSPLAGRVTAIAPSPSDADTAYVGAADGGVWKTTDGGATWTPIFDDQSTLAIGALAVDPSNPNIVYAGTGEANYNGDAYFGDGIYESTNGGRSWTRLTLPCSPAAVGQIVVKPGESRIVLAAIRCANGIAGIIRSSDGGLTWASVLGPVSGQFPYVVWLPSIAVADSSPNVWFATARFADASGGVWKSTDSGSSWTLLTGGGGYGRGVVAVAPTDANRIYSVWATNTSFDPQNQPPILFASSDGGESWSRPAVDTSFCNIGAGYQCWYDLALAVSPSDATSFYAAGIELFRYRSGGASHTTIGYGSNGVHVDFHALAFDDSGRLWVGNDGGVYRTSDDGLSFSNLNADLPITQFYPGSDGAPATKFLGGTQDLGSIRGSDSTWTQVFGGDGGYSAIDPTNANTLYITNPGLQIYRSTDDGASWTYAASGIGSEGRLFIAPLIMDPSNSQTLYAGTKKVYRSTNGAGSWTAISPDLTQQPEIVNHALTSLAVAPGDPSTIYACTNVGRNWVTRDGGLSWSQLGSMPSGPGGAPTKIVVDPRNPGHLFVSLSGFDSGGSGEHIYESSDGGQTFADISRQLPNIPANSLAVDFARESPIVYVGTDVGVFWSASDGDSWRQTSRGLPNSAVMDLRLVGSTLVAATHGRGVYTAPSLRPSAAPTITSFSPTSGTVGTSVTITGTNFTGATAVAFNGTRAKMLRVESSTQIVTKVPHGATTGPISVTAPGGTATSASPFTTTK